MRAIALFAILQCAAFCGEPRPLPEKLRAELDRIDARIALLNRGYEQQFPKSVELKNRVTTLRERFNEAKNPASRERFEKALANNEEQLKALQNMLDGQRQEIHDLKVKRGLMTAPILAKEDSPRGEHFGRSYDFELPRAALIAAFVLTSMIEAMPEIDSGHPLMPPLRPDRPHREAIGK